MKPKSIRRLHARVLVGLLVCSGLPVAAGEDGEPSIEVQTGGEVRRRAYRTARVTGEPPAIDGDINDPVWDNVEWSSDFVQRDPSDGEPPTLQTRFKVVFDDEALYFAFKLDDDPEEVSPVLSRRDSFPGDWVEVNIDSYGDDRTAFSFTISASGTRSDELISNDGGNWDASFNPVWTGKAKLTEDGWAAETRIPLSQLRFSGDAEQTWGLQVMRRLFRHQERSTWQHIPKDSSGWVSQFGDLRGLDNLKPARRMEFLPYMVARAESYEKEAGNPFRTGNEAGVEVGIDGKIGITNNLTLDFTFNPDFGQVEADPSEVNLSNFESFFEEQRPFFVEGKQILDLSLAPAITGGSFTDDTLFYSRRVGISSGYRPNLPTNAYFESPDATTILGAVKLSGKTASGLSIGILDSVTDKETGHTYFDGNRASVTVEPLTNYFVGRLQQDFRGGDTQIGGMVTAVNREIEDNHLEFLREESYAGGFDFSTYFKDRNYRLEANLLGSTIRGSQESIALAQTSSARYFQRPDNESASFDPTRTSLSGHSGSVRLTRTNNHALMFQSGVAWRSPGFEINDLGFMRSADQINQFTWVGYSKRNPFSIFDRWQLNGNQWLDWDSSGNFLGYRWNVNTNAQFKNKFSAGMGLTRRAEFTSNTELRGGPSSIWPGNWGGHVWGETDSRKKVYGNIGGSLQEGDENSGSYKEMWGGVTYRPSNALRFSVRPSLSHNQREMQYVTTRDLEDDRFVYGSLDQETFALTLRVDYSITPDLTIQLYGAPFVSVGRYDTFKRITDPHANSYRDRFATFDDGQIAYNPETGFYSVDENGDGTGDYSFHNPDFDLRDFNSNLVVRWEFRPGSTLYFVWAQVRNSSERISPNLGIPDDLSNLFSATADDVLLIKFGKWFNP
jgi:hypothetical protein